LQKQHVKEFFNTKDIEVIRVENDAKLYFMVELHNENHYSSVEIKHLHTNITQIRRDKELLLQQVHIKTNVGRLSAYCGVICSAAAVSGALCYENSYNYLCCI